MIELGPAVRGAPEAPTAADRLISRRIRSQGPRGHDREDGSWYRIFGRFV